MLSFPVSVNFSFSFHLIVEPDPHCSYLACCSIPSSWATYHVFLTQWLMKRNKFKEVEGLKRNNWDVISHTFFSTVCRICSTCQYVSPTINIDPPSNRTVLQHGKHTSTQLFFGFRVNRLPIAAIYMYRRHSYHT